MAEIVNLRAVRKAKSKAEARAIRHGFPWVYADELVTDRRTQGLAPGADLRAQRLQLGCALFGSRWGWRWHSVSHYLQNRVFVKYEKQFYMLRAL